MYQWNHTITFGEIARLENESGLVLRTFFECQRFRVDSCQSYRSQITSFWKYLFERYCLRWRAKKEAIVIFSIPRETPICRLLLNFINETRNWKFVHLWTSIQFSNLPTLCEKILTKPKSHKRGCIFNNLRLAQTNVTWQKCCQFHILRNERKIGPTKYMTGTNMVLDVKPECLLHCCYAVGWRRKNFLLLSPSKKIKS